MLGQGESSRPESEYESAEQDVKRNLSGVGLAVDQRDTHPSPLLARGSAKRWSSRQMWNAGMELDPPGTSPYSIATSSSIPSSSRSSLRASRPPPTGRTVSLSYSDPKLAEPKVEKTTSSGEGVPWETEVGEEDKGDKEDMGNEHHGGHLLRNLVGGMFRRKSHSYRPPRAATEAGIITAFTSKLPSIPHPRSSAPEPPPPDGTITHISPSARAVRSSPVRSPPHARSPGIAMAVTPRVRTRDERRVESFNRDRVGIGSAADGGGPGVVVGDREERRARLD